MTEEIKGRVYFLDRENVDTDQIIPARHLDVVTIKGLGEHLFEDLDLPGFSPEDPAFKEASILVSRDNFGCGSSREHAVWALEDNGFQVVIAPSFARIFRQNMFNRALLAIELPGSIIQSAFEEQWQRCVVDLEKMEIAFVSAGAPSDSVHSFQLTDFDKNLVLQGGLVGFVVRNY